MPKKFSTGTFRAEDLELDLTPYDHYSCICGAELYLDGPNDPRRPVPGMSARCACGEWMVPNPANVRAATRN